MSLNDLDKNDDQRRFPRPNANDNVPHRMAHNTIQHTYRQVNSSVVPRMIFRNGIIIWFDQDNKVSAIFGYVPEVSGIPIEVIAKSGYDVFDDILGVDQPTV